MPNVYLCDIKYKQLHMGQPHTPNSILHDSKIMLPYVENVLINKFNLKSLKREITHQKTIEM